MMTFIVIAHVLLNLAIAARLFLFNRAGTVHRPRASFVAWLWFTGAIGESVYSVFGQISLLWPRLLLDVLLCIAMFSVRGNVVALFQPSDGFETRFIRWLRKPSWH